MFFPLHCQSYKSSYLSLPKDADVSVQRTEKEESYVEICISTGVVGYSKPIICSMRNAKQLLQCAVGGVLK